jgi:DNA-binding SARP family transcriptional activator/TolB-like protein
MEMLRLRTFGGLSLEGARSGGATAMGRRPLALLALLAVAGERGLSRDKVIALLWPERDEERGRNSLSQALSSLRREIANGEPVSGLAEVRLNPDVISSDVEEFERYIAGGDLEPATQIYQGPFLDGFFLRDAPEFERWVEEHRSRLRHTQATALRHLAEESDRRDDRSAAVSWWRRLAAFEPTSARAAVGLMEALAATGDRAAALQHYRVHEALVQQELGVAAEDTVIALAARLRMNGRQSALPGATSPNAATPPTVSAIVHSGPGNAPSRPPLAVPTDDAGGVPVARDSRPIGGSWPRARWFALGAAVSLAGIALVALRAARRPSYNPRQVVVAGFINRTGDSTLNTFGFLAADYITDGLQRSGLVEVTDPGTALLATTQGRDPAKALDDAKEAQLMAEATHAGIVVTGHYYREADSIAIVARVADAARGKLISVTEPVRVAAAAPSDGLQSVRQRVLGILAGRLDERLTDVLAAGWSSPPMISAYGEYVDGVLEFQRGRQATALPHFQRAYELDSTFVAPLMWQLWVGTFPGPGFDRRAVLQELGRHRQQLNPLDRHALDYFEATDRRDIPARILALQQASKLSPGSIWTYNLGNALVDVGRDDEAVAAFEQIDRRHGWMRGWPTFWGAYSRALHYIDHRRELEVVREERRVVLPPGDTHGAFGLGLLLAEARALAMLGRTRELARIVTDVQARPATAGNPGNILEQIAEELWSRGDTTYSREVVRRALAWFRSLPEQDARQRLIRASFARALYDADHWAEARSMFEQLVAEAPNDWWSLMFVGLCFAREGERERAEEILGRLIAVGDSADDMNLVVTSGAVRIARLAAVLGHRELATQSIKDLNSRTGGLLSRHAQHKDFDSLAGYAPWLAVTRPFK